MALPNNPDQEAGQDISAVETTPSAASKSILKKPNAPKSKKSVNFFATKEEIIFDIENQSKPIKQIVAENQLSGNAGVKRKSKAAQLAIQAAAEKAVEEIYTHDVIASQKLSDAKTVETICANASESIKTELGTIWEINEHHTPLSIFQTEYYQPARQKKSIKEIAALCIAQKRNKKITDVQIFSRAEFISGNTFSGRAYIGSKKSLKYCQTQDDVEKLLTLKICEIEILNSRAISLKKQELDMAKAKLETLIAEYTIRMQYNNKDSDAVTKCNQAKPLLQSVMHVSKFIEKGKSIGVAEIPKITVSGELLDICKNVKTIRNEWQQIQKKIKKGELNIAEIKLEKISSHTIFNENRLTDKLNKLLADLEVREINYVVRINKGQEHRGFAKKTKIKSATEKLFATKKMIQEAKRLLIILEHRRDIQKIPEWNNASANEGSSKKYYTELLSLSAEVKQVIKNLQTESISAQSAKESNDNSAEPFIKLKRDIISEFSKLYATDRYADLSKTSSLPHIFYLSQKIKKELPCQKNFTRSIEKCENIDTVEKLLDEVCERTVTEELETCLTHCASKIKEYQKEHLQLIVHPTMLLK
ncbi:MAG TPA: hypothetical protein VJK30_02635 [Coxiellaceae bacterium]|nr:MAG: hypothetical protein A3E81_02635 [Gammaproteobacteria bacterium RIFCSPHIGHO2_12_FULL_36_30]HLB56211.1 hypothetical protein [Coxiellaceae bacterium]